MPPPLVPLLPPLATLPMCRHDDESSLDQPTHQRRDELVGPRQAIGEHTGGPAGPRLVSSAAATTRARLVRGDPLSMSELLTLTH